MEPSGKNDYGETDAEKSLTEAKEARKRAKAKAKSMHARIFKKKEEADSAQIKASSTRTRRTQGLRHGEAIPSNALRSSSARSHDMPSRPTFGASHATMKRPKVKRSVSGGSASCRRSSISSISELEAVVIFDDPNTSGSSFSQLTGSSGSFQFSLPGAAPITQGPSKFETTRLEKGSTAPKMPKRGNSIRHLDCGNDSCDSLNLGDIVEEEPTSPTCNTSHTTGRPWFEGCLASSQGVIMPIREDSVDNITNESSALESSLSGVSFFSSSYGSSAADSFALLTGHSKSSPLSTIER
mmetsp:Transcript_11367/g.21704  ORF Transcript_11367/g.21704 Transcript_11367/m.21704 type:complete len:297 (-) Transcript_11367:119-1009(-)|eukprot:scaffold1915_cov144-Amphora_coffeaeformis.AAC.10